jgi:hypothetical protein
MVGPTLFTIIRACGGVLLNKAVSELSPPRYSKSTSETYVSLNRTLLLLQRYLYSAWFASAVVGGLN